ncbi:MAG: enoyl-CoA hydratase/isomerase family protein [Myxococcales bacterium]|nr:enoyl-CoA hydratase/isomerase family protein [Myxococcales bacterium]
MTYEQIRVERDGPIASIVLNRPEARNAMTARMGAEITRAVAELNADADVRVVLARGEGKAFAAGGDFKFLEERAADLPERNRAAMGDFYRSFLSIRKLRVPSIAVLHGAAVGAGLCFALACDIRLAAEGAKLGLNFVRIGIHPGMGGSWLLPRLVGPAKAAELILTGRIIEAAEAARIGLVNDVFAPDQLSGVARAMAEEIATAAPIAVAQAKGSIYRSLERSLDVSLEEEAYAQAVDYATADFAEGVRSFYERRAPRFEGR